MKMGYDVGGCWMLSYFAGRDSMRYILCCFYDDILLFIFDALAKEALIALSD